MADRARPVGYLALIERFGLPLLGLARETWIHEGARRETHTRDGGRRVVLPSAYDPGDQTLDHLVFAIKHEGIELRVLRAVLAAMPAEALCEAVRSRPTGRFLRRLWFLHEWLGGAALPLSDVTQGNYVELFDPAEYVTGRAWNSRRHRVRVNGLSADARLCPVIRRTPTLTRRIEDEPRLDARVRAFVREVPPTVLWRATAYLYDKETRSSYAIERESPREPRVERFVRVLREAGDGAPMSRALLVRVQNAIVETDYIEPAPRTEQNWVGRSTADFREEVFLLPPTPDALPALLDAWVELANQLTRADDNPVPAMVAAAALSFAFVYLHPFLDGNGRLHRWLIHWALARRGFGSKGTVLPISAVILREMARYDEVLEAISRPMREHVRYEFRGRQLVVLDEHRDLFRHLDLTTHAEALGDWLTQTVERELDEEVRFIERFDRAVQGMRSVREMPDARERLFVQCVVQNRGRLAQRKRDHFRELDDETVHALEAAVREAFSLEP